jgi:hypothetical protein
MESKILNKCRYIIFALASLSALNSCQPDDASSSNGLADLNPINASFTITPVSGVLNRYTLEALNNNALGSKWELGDGSSTYVGKIKENVFFPDAGTYNIKHTAIGKGGSVYTSAKELVVATSDLNSGNLVVGGKFTNATDHSKWTVLKIAGTSTFWTFNAGSATITGTSGGWDQQGIYQAVDIIGGKNYKIDMEISGSACQNTWFEVYASPVKPVQGGDYTSDGRRIGMSTWDGCATAPFSGKLSEVKCVGSGNIVKFSQSGTIYLVIKSGGNNLGVNGITIKNVEMRGV